MQLRFLLLLGLFVTLPVTAQVRINEAVSKNDVFRDGDYDTPDWLELHNAGPEAVDLTGWALTDKIDQPKKWPIENLVIPADGYQLVWASGKDRRATIEYRSLVRFGSACRFVVPDVNTPDNWIDLDFDDAIWRAGTSSLGYGDGPYGTWVSSNARSIFVRHEFTLTDTAGLEALLLHVDFDDGFAAYLNGREVAIVNMIGPRPLYDAFTTDRSEGRISNGDAPQAVEMRDAAGLLQPGRNVLAIQVHNNSEASTDVTLSAFLTARFGGASSEGEPLSDHLDLGTPAPHANFKISAGGETLYLFDAAGNLRSELTVEGLPANVSVGLAPGGAGIRLFDTPTPGRANGPDGFAGAIGERVRFSRPGGLADAFSLELSGAPAGGEIRYTTDATEPTVNDSLYSEPILIEETTVVRARIFRGEQRPSPTYSETYLIGTDHDIDVVSLVTEPELLFDPIDGIYVFGRGASSHPPFYGANFWRDQEIGVHFSLFPLGEERSFSQDVGLKIFGAFSRSNPQRSFALFARDRYGADEMDYRFFASRPFDSYTSLVLRNAGNDWPRSMMRDATMTMIMEGSGLDVQAYRPVATYLNGEYWGLYNLREKVNEDWLAAHHGIDPDKIDLLERFGDVVEGSNLDYLALTDYARRTDLSDPESFKRIEDEIDVDNYLTYYTAQIFYGNWDWPGNNVKFWRSPEKDGKWRWILFDTDFGLNIFNDRPPSQNDLYFAFETNGPVWPNPPISTEFSRDLLENESFRHRFVNRFADALNSRFLFPNTNAILSTNEARIENEMVKTKQRWNYPLRFAEYADEMRSYLRERPGHVKSHLLDYFDLAAFHETTILNEDTTAGYVTLNSLTIERENWSGDYFEGVPITLTAVAREGYEFVRWELDTLSSEGNLSVNLRRPMAFQPVFREKSNALLPGSDPSALRDIQDFRYSPNPGGGPATIAFTTSQRTRVSAQLIDPRGVLVRTITEGTLTPGDHRFDVDLSTLPAGAYWLNVVENDRRSVALKWIVK